MQRFLPYRGDEANDDGIVDLAGLDPPRARVAGEPRQTKMGAPPRQPLEESDPSWAQGLLDLDPDRHHAARLHRRQKVGADVGEALGRHAGGDWADGGEPGPDRLHIKRDAPRFIAEQVSVKGQICQVLQPQWHVGQNCNSECRLCLGQSAEARFAVSLHLCPELFRQLNQAPIASAGDVDLE